MSNSMEDQTLEAEPLEVATNDQNPSNQQSDQAQEWETMARAWVCAFPDAKAVSTSEVEAWVDNNHDSLAEGLKSMPRNQLIDSFLKIQEHLRPQHTQEKEANQLDLPPARFQRTDQWRPVYSWLESLDKDEPVKSKDISDWLTENPDIREQLCSKHSRYHLMHYIKKCHMKILKRKDRKKGLQQSDKTSPNVQKSEMSKELVLLPSNPLGNVPKDSDLYMAKRNEALRKYEILVELEKQLLTMGTKRQKI